MSVSPTSTLSPSASFIVERQPGKGYQVAFADGPYADERKGRALAMLDCLGQPDPNGPTEYCRLVGPIPPSGEYVGVFVKLAPNGEAGYHQAWFHIPEAATHRGRFLGSLALVLMVGFVLGGLAARTFFVSGGATPAGPASDHGLPVSANPNPPVKEPPRDVHVTKLKNEIRSSRDLRMRLKDYLSQEGFAADASLTVIEQKRSVKLIADLDKTPPPVETIRLSNIEVGKLLKLLETLEDVPTALNDQEASDGQ